LSGKPARYLENPLTRKRLLKNSNTSLLRFDFQGALIDRFGIQQAELVTLHDDLDKARSVVLEDVSQFNEGKIPVDKEPLDAAYIELPEKLLRDYETKRDESELGQILNTARRLQEQVDRVVVLGIGGSYMGAKALMEACCEPYFNELSRAQRGGRPRMYFEGNNVDNDALQGLLNLLERDDPDFKDPFAIVVISKSGGTLETAVAFRTFLDALKNRLAGREECLAELVVPVTGDSGKLHELSQAIGCKDVYRVPDGVGGRFSILSAVGLLPAAILGLDVVALLQGAAQMNDHFRSTSIRENIVADFVGVNHLLERNRGVNTRVLSVWSKGLEYVGLWYDQLLAESLGKKELGAFPLTAVNTRDLHSRAQQHQEGRRDKVMNNLIVENWKCDPVTVQSSDWNQDKLNEFAGKTVPQIMQAAIAGTNQAYAEDQRPTTDLLMPECNERYLGQFFQMMMLATSLEGRLLGINPYGQPGVEKYKQNMFRILRGG
jgi:glucose-6-phosphate isomerase